MLAVAFGLLLAAPIAGVSLAQDPATAEPPAQPRPTYEDPSIPVAHLDLRLKPLTQDHLAVELEGWISVVEAKQRELSLKEIEALVARENGEDDVAFLEAATALALEHGKILDRAARVIKAFEDKGGDAAKEKKYLDAISGLSFKADDAGAMWTRLRAWATSSDGGVALALAFAKFVATLIVFWILSRIVAGVVSRALDKAKRLTALLRDFFVGATRKLVLFIGAIIAVSMFGVDIGPMLAAIGAAGFVIGFALQDTLSNFASGLMILFYRPYDVGNFVSIAGESGTVEKMSLVSTSLRTPDNQLIVIPNNSIWGGNITNVTGTSRRRVDLVFGIGYSDDIAKAEKILEEIVTKHESVLEEPAPVIRVHELGDSSVNFVVRPWVRTSDYWGVYWDITRSVKERFDQEGISIPFPQRDIHLHTVEASG